MAEVSLSSLSDRVGLRARRKGLSHGSTGDMGRFQIRLERYVDAGRLLDKPPGGIVSRAYTF